MERLLSIIDQVTAVSEQTIEFIAGLSETAFLHDVLKQRALTMNLVIIGGAADEVIDGHPAFLTDHPQIDWFGLRDLRAEILRELSMVNPVVLWSAAKDDIPQLLSQLSALRHIHAQGE